MNDPTSAKRALRREMRALRRGIADADGVRRSRFVGTQICEVIDRAGASTVMLYDAVHGEPDLAEVAAWCETRGIATVVPDSSPDADRPVASEVPDVIVLPGLAFGDDGARLGQGGGWFDRFVSGRRADCLLVGVCFHEQLVAAIPVEPHDVPVDLIVTDHGVVEAASFDR